MSSQAFRPGGRPISLLKGALGAAVALGSVPLSPGEAKGSQTPQTGQALLKLSRISRLKHRTGRAALGAALLMSSLHAGAASALSFNFTFSGTGTPNNPATVTGIVDGLIDNTNNQRTGLTLTITSATNTPPGGWPVFTDANYVSPGDGFDVSGGQVTGVNIYYVNGASSLRLGNQSLFRTQLLNGVFDINESRNDPGNSLSFTTPTQASVPGPLPLLGAGAAFGWSRRLRRRIKTSA